MLKYKEVIAKLSDSQKIRILTGVASLSGKDMKVLGIPAVTVGDMKNYCKYIYPRASALVNAWNSELWSAVAAEKVKEMASEGIGLAVSPGAKVKFSPYRRDLTEDSYLAEKISAAYSSACDANGMTNVMSGFYLTESDVDWMDKVPNERVINEYLVKPYKNAIADGKSKAIFVDERIFDGEYAFAAADMVRNAKHFDAEFLVCSKASDDNTVDLVRRGIICLEGSPNALDLALKRYRSLMKSVESGMLDAVNQIEQEQNLGIAISDDEINNALDHTLDFIFKSQVSENVAENDSDSKALAVKAIRESTVLLKNNRNFLPMDRTLRYAIIGSVGYNDGSGLLFADRVRAALERKLCRCRVAEGYDAEGFDDAKKIAEAVSLCKDSDAAILFLGFGDAKEKAIRRNESLTIPANQLKLADEIAKTGKPTVVVLSSGHIPDIEFTRAHDCLLFAPLELESSAEVISGILLGEYNPSGKLACTLYSGSETAFQKRSVYKNKYGMKAGPFIGYRYYDTAGMRVGYPFGYGLSYTSFAYSSLSVKGKTVSFSVRNVGEVDGSEIAEVYLGLTDSKVIRPKKELVGFAKIDLMPGEKKRVTVKFDIPGVFSDGSFVTESGTYKIYVGSSVFDIKLEGKLAVNAYSLMSDGERQSDYLQSVSNVIEDKYTLEADYITMKKSVTYTLFAIGLIVVALSLAIFNAATELSSLFLGIVAGILAVGSIVLFILQSVERHREYRAALIETEKKNEEYFSDAERVMDIEPEKIFSEVFDTVETSVIDTADETVLEDTSQYIDNDFRFATAVDDFTRFASHRGYKFASGVISDLFASFASSRLIITGGISDSDFNSLMLLLSEYFDSESCIDSLKNAESEMESIGYDSVADDVKQIVLLALAGAANVPERVHIIAFSDAEISDIANALSPFVRYLSSPKDKNVISITGENDKCVTYEIPDNFWVVLNLSKSESIDELPMHIARISAVNRIQMSKTLPSDEHYTPRLLNKYQLQYMLEKEGGKNEISEEVWKKVDKFEKYASSLSDYQIGNKLWLGFEKHVGMLLACNTEINDAVDSAIAVKLLPSISASLRTKIGAEDKTILETLEFIFGEENISACKDFLGTLVSVNKEQVAAETLVQTSNSVNVTAVDDGYSEVSTDPINDNILQGAI